MYLSTHFHLSLAVLLFFRGIDNVDDLMADIAEQQEVAQEISDAISRPFGAGVDYDEVRTDQNLFCPWKVSRISWL